MIETWNLEDAITPDIDFPFATNAFNLFANSYDCCYIWPEFFHHLKLKETFTATLGFSTDNYLSKHPNPISLIKSISKASHTYTLALNNATITAQNHTVWTSDLLPIVSRRADHKNLHYEYDSIKNVLNLMRPDGNPKHLRGSYYLLSDRWTEGNLYHWTYDSISRLAIFFELRKIYPDLKLLCINDHNLVFHQEWLRLLNLSQDVLTYSSHASYCVEHLLYTPRIGLTSPVNMGSHFSKLLEVSGIQPSPLSLISKNLFINRRAGPRALINSGEICCILKEYHFHQVYLEDFSITGKLLLALSCKRLIAIGGSGMFLLSFMQPGSSVLEIAHDKSDCPAHLIHSFAVQHNYGYCVGRHVLNEQIQLDPLILKACINIMP